jgi:hypothetical protein
MKTAVLIIFTLFAASAQAQVVAGTARGIAVAHDGRLEIYDDAGHSIASFDGVAQPSKIVSSGERVAVIDTWANRIRIAAPDRSITTAESPVDAIFVGSTLFVLARDAAVLQRIAADGSIRLLPLAPDPAFMREQKGRLLVYSRLDGLIQEISTEPFAITRRVRMPPGASDLELDNNSGYLVYPADAELRTFGLASLKATGVVKTGAVPVDATLVRESSAVSAALIAVADPSSRRIWSVEGRQSPTAAFARGFIRGFIGLGLGSLRGADFPTGVDRVISGGRRTIAYDSSSGTLYRIEKAKGVVIARDIAPAAFAIVENGVAVWEGGRLRLIR